MRVSKPILCVYALLLLIFWTLNAFIFYQFPCQLLYLAIITFNNCITTKWYSDYYHNSQVMPAYDTLTKHSWETPRDLTCLRETFVSIIISASTIMEVIYVSDDDADNMAWFPATTTTAAGTTVIIYWKYTCMNLTQGWYWLMTMMMMIGRGCFYSQPPEQKECRVCTLLHIFFSFFYPMHNSFKVWISSSSSTNSSISPSSSVFTFTTVHDR